MVHYEWFTMNGIQQVGNWKQEINTLLQDALQTSIDVCGRTGEQACQHAIILMVQSAAKMTPQAKKNRTLQRDEKRRPYLEAYTKKGIRRWYLPNRKQNPQEYAAMLAKLRPIRNRGLAKRSWMWGLSKLPRAPRGSRPMAGITWLRTILGDKASGYVLTNSLSYLLKILPSGWQASVAAKAASRIMAQAKLKLERDWKREMERSRRAGIKTGATLSKYFLKV